MNCEFQTQPPPQIEQSQHDEPSGPESEHAVDQHMQPNRQRFQPTPFHNKGPNPLLVRLARDFSSLWTFIYVSLTW